MILAELRRVERIIYQRELGPMPAAALVEPCRRCGRDTLKRKPRRVCGSCLVRRH